MSPTYPALYAISVLLVALSLISYVAIQFQLTSTRGRSNSHNHNVARMLVTTFYGLAIIAGLLLWPAAGVTPNGHNGYGKPGHVLGWLGAEAGIWIVACFIITSVVNRLPSRKHSHT